MIPGDLLTLYQSTACTQCLRNTLHILPLMRLGYLIPCTSSQKPLGEKFASSKSCAHSQGELELSITIQDPGASVRSRCISVYWKTKMSQWEKKLALARKSFVSPSLPLEVKDRPAGALPSAWFLDSELLPWKVSTPVSGEGRGENKKNTHEYFMQCLCWLFSSLNTH